MTSKPTFLLRRVPVAVLVAGLLATSVAVEAQTADAAASVAPTRQEVHDALELARAGNRITPDGEIGDTPDVLRAREEFAALQQEVLATETARAKRIGREAVSQGELDYETLAQLLAQAAVRGEMAVVVIHDDREAGASEDSDDAAPELD